MAAEARLEWGDSTLGNAPEKKEAYADHKVLLALLPGASWDMLQHQSGTMLLEDYAIPSLRRQLSPIASCEDNKAAIGQP